MKKRKAFLLALFVAFISTFSIGHNGVKSLQAESVADYKTYTIEIVDTWDKDGARFSAWCWSNSKAGEWCNLTINRIHDATIMKNNFDNIFSFKAPKEATHFQLYRFGSNMPNSNTVFWGKTGNFELSTTSNFGWLNGLDYSKMQLEWRNENYKYSTAHDNNFKNDYFNLYMVRGKRGEIYHWNGGANKLILTSSYNGKTIYSLPDFIHAFDDGVNGNNHLLRYRVPTEFIGGECELSILNDDLNSFQDVTLQNGTTPNVYSKTDALNTKIMVINYDDKAGYFGPLKIDDSVASHASNNFISSFYEDLLNSYDSCSTNNYNGFGQIEKIIETYKINDNIDQISKSIMDDGINPLTGNPYTGLEKVEQLKKKQTNISNNNSNVINTIGANKKTIIIGGASVGGLAILGCFGLFLKKRKFN